MSIYGKELILDLYDCDASKFTRASITAWLTQLCDLIGMEREDLHFWDYEECQEEKAKAPAHLVGTSAVQFISTSDIVIHTIDNFGECYVNLFSCKEYDPSHAVAFTVEWFNAKKHEKTIINRGRLTRCSTDIVEDDCLQGVSHGKCSGAQWIRQSCSRFSKE